MKDFQAIADANPSPADGMPSRNSGEPGYRASVDYVANAMTAAGYNVTIQPYKFTYYAYRSEPTLSEVSPAAQSYLLGTDWYAGRSTGTTQAALQPAGGIIIPPSPTPSSSSGCTPADFTGFVPGRIALIQRGGCHYGVKVLNAQAAGASGVIIFNEGQTGRTAAVAGNLADANGQVIIPTIPVAFTSFAVGNALYTQYQATIQNGSPPPVMSLRIDAIVKENADDYNVIAESQGGDKNHVVVVDAHLDAIDGAGMLDNASGSSTILDIAQQMKNVNPLNKLRFIWFGGEEIGDLGSLHYINNLHSDELSHIGYVLDADVMASPNYIIGINDPAANPGPAPLIPEPFPNRVYKASEVSRDQSIAYFASIGKNSELVSPSNTDSAVFHAAGIPGSGMQTGQDCCKTQNEVDLFGGSLGNFEGSIPSFDGGCVDNPFHWCDNLSNNDPNVLTFMSKAFANTVVQMAFDTKVMSASNDSVYNPKLPITSEVVNPS
jgi:Zn-dependent M28 family amino/carboxypeptidase